MRGTLFSLLILLLLARVPGGAAVIDAPGEYGSVQAAIDASADGDEIVIAPGAYDEQLRIEGRLLSVRGGDSKPVFPSVSVTSSTLMLQSVATDLGFGIHGQTDQDVMIADLEIGYYMVIEGGHSFVAHDLVVKDEVYCNDVSEVSFQNLKAKRFRPSHCGAVTLRGGSSTGDGNFCVDLNDVAKADISDCVFGGLPDSCVLVYYGHYPVWYYYPPTAAVAARDSPDVFVKDSVGMTRAHTITSCGSIREYLDSCAVSASSGSHVELLNVTVSAPMPLGECTDSTSSVIVLAEDRPIGWVLQ